ncbi:hypothetical protein GCWU000282_00506 [Catonella morbi ATCC 51271]|uniref:LPXTG-motif protein cell wall anchor domain protein n=1 Tax=Catonella morbi ATCC 51271 TaxID=592026 RepID=V2XPS6_9FIRM|nr:Cna B-type domain-containing protein [Catonella morbi]ESL04159.1 hypothetical protein GCWU000282_00506 [Catonella morbi ATCC 51271]
MRSRSQRKNSMGVHSVLAKFMILLMIINVLNVIHPAAVRADDTKHFGNNTTILPEGGITAKNYNNGKFDVEMVVKGDGSTTIEQKNLDVVLVVDRSYDNMRKNGRMAAAKAEAAKLVDYFLQSGNNKIRVGLVSFAGNNGGSPSPVLGVTQLTQDADELKNAIRGYNTAGWNNSPVLREAFTQAGLIKANEMFGASNTNKKIIVLISGGAPTISYGLTLDFNQREEALSNTPKEGYEIWSLTRWLDPKYHSSWKKGYHKSNEWTPYYVKLVKGLIDVPMGKTAEVKTNTIAEANKIKTDSGVEIFSVGIKADGDAAEVLKKIASDNRYYVDNILKDVIDKVIESLKEVKKEYSIKDGDLEIKMNEAVKSELDPSKITLTAQNTDSTATAEDKADLARRFNEINKEFDNKTLTLRKINLGKNEVLNIKYQAELLEAYKDGNPHNIVEYVILYPEGKNGSKEVNFAIPTVKEAIHSSVAITKVWEGKPADTANFGLFKKVAPDDRLERIPNANPKISKNANQWTIKFENVKTFDINGKAIEYVVKELNEQGNPLKTGEVVTLNNRKYRISESDNGKTITNTELIDISVEKNWADGVPEIAMQSVKFRITEDNKSAEFNKTYELNKANGWTKKFENLPLYKGNEKIKYSVVETYINGEKITEPINPEADSEGNHVYYYKAFKITLSKNAIDIIDSGKVTITNSVRKPEQNIPDKRRIKVVNNWGKTPDSKKKEIEVSLYKVNKDGELIKVDDAASMVLNKNNETDKDWQGEFVVDNKDKDGNLIQYYVFETRIDNATTGAVKFDPNLYNDGYKIGEYNVRISELTSEAQNAEAGDYGFYILNESEGVSTDPATPEEKIDINVTKTWTGSTPVGHKLPVKVRLFIENGEYLVPVTNVAELTLNDGNNWTGKFENLEKIVDNYGNEIKYYVYEVGVGNNNIINNSEFMSKPAAYKIGSYNVTIAGNGTIDVTITNDHKPAQAPGGGAVDPGNPGNSGNPGASSNQGSNTPNVNVTDDKTPQGTVNTDTKPTDEDTDETGVEDIDDDDIPEDEAGSNEDTDSGGKTKAPNKVKVNEDNVPRGKAALPKTGGTDSTLFGVLGFGLIGLGFLIKKRR